MSYVINANGGMIGGIVNSNTENSKKSLEKIKVSSEDIKSDMLKIFILYM